MREKQLDQSSFGEILYAWTGIPRTRVTFLDISNDKKNSTIFYRPSTTVFFTFIF